MAKIKINDLPQDVQISREEMKKVLGGIRPDDGGLVNPKNHFIVTPEEWINLSNNISLDNVALIDPASWTKN